MSESSEQSRETGPDVWRLTVTAPDHERVFRTITGDRHTAATRLAQLAAEHGHPPDTLNTLVAVYLGVLAQRGRSPSTLRRYEQLWRTWLARSVGPKHLDELRGVDIEGALALMHQAGKAHDRSTKPPSCSTPPSHGPGKRSWSEPTPFSTAACPTGQS